MNRVEKLCKKDYKDESSWLITHIKFCRKGDVVRIDGVKDKLYESVSDPIWKDVHKDWWMDFVVWDMV